MDIDIYMLSKPCMHNLALLPFADLLTQLSLWLRDVLDDLCHRKLKDMADFEWQRYIRPYLASPPPEEASAPSENTQEDTVVLRCLDQQVEYGFEYMGCASLPVFTPRANNYVIAFTQVSMLRPSVYLLPEVR